MVFVYSVYHMYIYMINVASVFFLKCNENRVRCVYSWNSFPRSRLYRLYVILLTKKIATIFVNQYVLNKITFKFTFVLLITLLKIRFRCGRGFIIILTVPTLDTLWFKIKIWYISWIYNTIQGSTKLVSLFL